jgi:ABC-type glycerol-3-phosphate transport system permease component
MVKIIGLIFLCAILLFPVWLMVTNSFTPAIAFLKMPPRLIPKDFTFKNYIQAFTLKYLPVWILNSSIIVLSVVILGVIVNGAAGYVFAFTKGKWANYIFWAMLSPIFVTGFVLIIARFIVVGKLGMRGLAAVIGMSIFWPTGIYLFKNYFKSIPMELIESARIDGAHEWTILSKIVLPLSRPILGAAVVFLGMGAMGDYIWQFLNLQANESKTFLVGLMQSAMSALTVKDIGYNLAVGTLLFIPYLLIFAVSSKYFVQGLTTGGTKE